MHDIFQETVIGKNGSKYGTVPHPEMLVPTPDLQCASRIELSRQNHLITGKTLLKYLSNIAKLSITEATPFMLAITLQLIKDLFQILW